jgi:hypothetical protein
MHVTCATVTQSLQRSKQNNGHLESERGPLISCRQSNVTLLCGPDNLSTSVLRSTPLAVSLRRPARRTPNVNTRQTGKRLVTSFCVIFGRGRSTLCEVRLAISSMVLRIFVLIYSSMSTAVNIRYLCCNCICATTA